VVVLPSRKKNIAFWSDHGKAFVVTSSLGYGEKNEYERTTITMKSLV
jgi:hypothetical protein